MANVFLSCPACADRVGNLNWSIVPAIPYSGCSNPMKLVTEAIAAELRELGLKHC